MPETVETKKNAASEQVAARSARGPSYPFFDLGKALAVSEKLHNAYKLFPIPEDTASKLMGYSPKASGGKRAIAALLEYGFVESVKGIKGRELKITDRARRILLKADDANTLLKQAALSPAAYKNIWNHFDGNLPPDESVRNYLIFKAEFSEEVAPKVIESFKRTILFGGLTPGSADTSDIVDDSLEENDQDDQDKASISKNPPAPPKPSNDLGELDKSMVELRFFVPAGEVLMRAPKKWSQKDSDILKVYLDAYLMTAVANSE